jgi:hypothetical protein
VCAYAYNMGGVDRVDRLIAEMRIRMKRTGKRYHRAIFWWILSLVVNNTFRVFEHLVPNYEKVMRDRGAPYTVYRRSSLSRSLITEGTRLWLETHGGAAPPWMPKRRGPMRRPPTPPISAIPLKHELVSLSAIIICARSAGVPAQTLPKGRCAQCQNDATLRDSATAKRLKPDIHPSPHKTIRQDATGCFACKVQLCSQCFYNRWDHNSQRAGNVYGTDIVFETLLGQTRVLSRTGLTSGGGGGGGGGGGAGASAGAAGGSGGGFTSPKPPMPGAGQVAVTPREGAGEARRARHGRVGVGRGQMRAGGNGMGRGRGKGRGRGLDGGHVPPGQAPRGRGRGRK